MVLFCNINFKGLFALVDQKASSFLHVAVEKNSLKILSLISTQKLKLTQKQLNATNGDGSTAFGMACRDMKCEAAKYLINAGVDVDKLSCKLHPAFLVDEAMKSKSVDSVSLENMGLLLVSILERSKVDHQAQPYYGFASAYHFKMIFGMC
jgi:hypothetical protein